MRRELEDWEWATIAAWIDTEGCIGTRTKKDSGSYRAGISITQKDPRPLLWLQERIEGNITRKRKDGCYRLRVNIGVERVLRNCLPYLLSKQEQAIAAIELCSRPDKDRQEELHFELRRLKRVTYG